MSLGTPGGLSIQELLADAEAHPGEAYDIASGPEHRQSLLDACLEVSVRTLDPQLRAVLSALWIVHPPFLALTH